MPLALASSGVGSLRARGTWDNSALLLLTHGYAYDHRMVLRGYVRRLPAESLFIQRKLNAMLSPGAADRQYHGDRRGNSNADAEVMRNESFSFDLRCTHLSIQARTPRSAVEAHPVYSSVRSVLALQTCILHMYPTGSCTARFQEKHGTPRLDHDTRRGMQEAATILHPSEAGTAKGNC